MLGAASTTVRLFTLVEKGNFILESKIGYGSMYIYHIRS